MIRVNAWPLESVLRFGMTALSGAVLSRPRPAPAYPARIAVSAPKHAKILVVTDAWKPQVNGVVRTLGALSRELSVLGHEVRFITPERLATLPLPSYPEIRLALFPRQTILRAIVEFKPDAIHVPTEGPMGFAARAICMERGFAFTTSFHTRFPEYVHARIPFVPKSAIYHALRDFHAAAHTTMVSTQSLKEELEEYGFDNISLWSRGVDVGEFKPDSKDAFERLGLSLPRPLFLYVGRVAVEKNLDAFLSLELPGTKIVIGDGPERQALQARYPHALFLGLRTGAELARLYAASDVFVFPSRTDTFGLVLLEALACGLPVAAFPVCGPRDVIGSAKVGVLRENLREACLAALSIPSEACRAFALTRSWRASAEQFLGHLAYQA
jgi:glycosyltransferase involved in cell wall biosynthesis